MKLNSGKRADVVDTSTGAVWEIKHSSTNTEGRIIQAQTQANGYIGSTTIRNKVKITSFGSPGAFSGHFQVEFMKSLYYVSYNTPAPGVILYSVRELPTPEPNYSAYVVTKSSEKTKIEKKPAGGVAAVSLPALIPICGGAVLTGIFVPVDQHPY
jgi:hypothetical protein